MLATYCVQHTTASYQNRCQGAPLDFHQADFVPPVGVASHPTDEALMLAYCKGDSQALATLYTRFGDPIYRFCLRCVGNSDLAQDFVQDIFVGIAKSRYSYQRTSAFRHYIFRMAHNRVVTHWRRHRDTVQLDNLEDQLPDTGSTPAQNVEDSDTASAIQKAIESLPEEQREVVLLRLEGDLTMQQIAEIQGVGVEAVKSRSRMAIKKLRDAVGHV